MRLISGIVALVYFLVGVLIASNHHYFAHVNDLQQVISAILAVVLWPLALLGVDLHLGPTGTRARPARSGSSGGGSPDAPATHPGEAPARTPRGMSLCLRRRVHARPDSLRHAVAPSPLPVGSPLREPEPRGATRNVQGDLFTDDSRHQRPHPYRGDVPARQLNAVPRT